MLLQLVSKIFNLGLCGHDPPTSQTDRQTDRQTTCDRKTALCTIVHRAVKMMGQNRRAVVDCSTLELRQLWRFSHRTTAARR